VQAAVIVAILFVVFVAFSVSSDGCCWIAFTVCDARDVFCIHRALVRMINNAHIAYTILMGCAVFPVACMWLHLLVLLFAVSRERAGRQIQRPPNFGSSLKAQLYAAPPTNMQIYDWH
jgi:hypothetical protein